MLNPMILQPDRNEKRKQNGAINQDLSVQMNGYSVDPASLRPSMGLWLGKLLIRMGQKLTDKDDELQTIRQHA